MESDEDFELLPPSPLHEPKPKLKRIKKALRVPPLSPSNHDVSSPIESGTLSSDDPSPSPEHVEDSNSNWGSNPQIDHKVTAPLDASDSDTPKGNKGFGAMRALDFDSIGDELDGNDEAHSKEMESEKEKREEVADLEIDDRGTKRRSLDEDSQDQEKNKKKRKTKDGVDGEMQPKESASNKRRTQKERRENLIQLRAESQRLLRETRDAAFKPIPVVKKPISSILDKIRQRKLEIQKKSSGYRDDNGYDSPDDDSERGTLDKEVSDKVEKAKLEETPASSAAIDNLDTLHVDGSKEASDYRSSESIPSPMAVGIEPEHEFRAPIDDTQELTYLSQSTDINDDVVCEKPINTSEEVPASSMLAMDLKLDSAPPDDYVSSDDEEEEDNDKENIDPRLHGPVNLPSPPSGDPVKAFVDEEAEEEDDSDNDMQRFQDNEEGEDDDDIEELNEMITPEYEEKLIDREKRDQLHQQWLEQQDTAGMDNLLHKLNCGSKLKEPTLIEEEEEDEESEEAENESDEEAEEYIAPSDAVKINLKKVKQMIPQMYTDKDNDYVSSDDEETEKMLDKQCLIDRAQERATFLSPSEDESSREVFSLIKKLNIVPDNKRKAKVPSFFETSLLGQKVNTSSKSSFVGRATNHFMPTTQKHGVAKVRSFIFERDDSSSRSSVSVSEESSETIQRTSQPAKAASAKFQRSTQKNSATLNSTGQGSSVSLLDILRRSSLHAERFVQNVTVQPKESVFDAFKLAKKPIKADAGI
ncbi:hypothetical protein PIB30_074121 [Stylosanthes scabra]|uniref:Uncharacterized protein n=1 Tax=Stylosanthes scabra TaxID=79078 RepID=A0ABU6SPP7_9FABA|nr:hypothetical protein [Stylosanthes scabra]